MKRSSARTLGARSVLAGALALALASVSTPLGAQGNLSSHGQVHARSGASVSQAPGRIRTSFNMAPPRIDTRVSRSDVQDHAAPIPRHVQTIEQSEDAQSAQATRDDSGSRVRVLGSGAARSSSSVRQSHVEERRSRRQGADAGAQVQGTPSYVQYGTSANSTFDFTFNPPPGGVVCDGLPFGVERMRRGGREYYAYAGTCLTRIYRSGVVCYRVVPCPDDDLRY